jgi:hypothetical protein
MTLHWHAENHVVPAPASRMSTGSGLHVFPAPHWLELRQTGSAVVMSQRHCPTMSAM